MKILSALALAIFLFSIHTYGQDTFSIVAVDSITGEVGSAGASCVDLTGFNNLTDHFIGELFPGVGAINSQAYYIPTNQVNARNRMNAGDTPSEIIEWLINNDVNNQPQLRQYGIVAFVDGDPESAAHTGTSTDDYKNHITGHNYSIQGNILLGPEVLESMESGFLNAEGDLACKLMAAMQGANMVGADSRCTSNGTSSLFAYVKVAQPGDSFGNPSFVQSLRTGDGAGIEPIDSLQILFDQAHNCTILGTNENLDDRFSIYPNPIIDLMIVTGQNNENYDLQVLDVSGRIVYSSSFREYLEVNVSFLHRGVYFIKISNNSKVSIARVIKS